MVVKNLLHVAPNAIANAYNIYNPDTQSGLGGFALANFSNPDQRDLHGHRRDRERHVGGDREVVRAVSWVRRCGC